MTTLTANVRLSILCTGCFDAHAKGSVLAVLPRSNCRHCGKLCLGYRTLVDVEMPEAQHMETDPDGRF